MLAVLKSVVMIVAVLESVVMILVVLESVVMELIAVKTAASCMDWEFGACAYLH